MTTRRIFLSLVLVLAPSLLAPARAAEGPAMTSSRELDLAAQHLAATARTELLAGELSPQAADTAAGFAALVRDFRFELEGDFDTSIQARVGWEAVAEGFTATLAMLHDHGSRALQRELLRVHALMNRLDRSFGGPGFWSGRHGWSG